MREVVEIRGHEHVIMWAQVSRNVVFRVCQSAYRPNAVTGRVSEDGDLEVASGLSCADDYQTRILGDLLVYIQRRGAELNALPASESGQGIYLGNWEKGRFRALVADFAGIDMGEVDGFLWASIATPAKKGWRPQICAEPFRGIHILLARYVSGCGGSGEAFVLFHKHGRLYEVNCLHDSGVDLYGAWHPHETTPEALLHRIDHGDLGQPWCDEAPFAEQLRGVIERWRRAQLAPSGDVGRGPLADRASDHAHAEVAD